MMLWRRRRRQACTRSARGRRLRASGEAQHDEILAFLARSVAWMGDAEALGLVDIKVLDHFIVAGQQVLSFAERGLL